MLPRQSYNLIAHFSFFHMKPGSFILNGVLYHQHPNGAFLAFYSLLSVLFLSCSFFALKDNNQGVVLQPPFSFFFYPLDYLRLYHELEFVHTMNGRSSLEAFFCPR